MNWTGLYAGVNVGGNWTQGLGSINLGAAPGVPASSVNLNQSFMGSITGGGQIGYNWHFPSNWVVGGEIDFNGTGTDRTTGLNFLVPVPGQFVAGDSFRFRSSWNGSGRVRLGYAWGSVLPYVTAGVAFADSQVSTNFVPVTSGGFNFPASRVSASSTAVGWTVGTGVEVALNPSWSLGAEYRYSNFGTEHYNLGSVAVTATGTPAAPVFTNAAVRGNVDLSSHVLLAKLNFHFNAPPPPPAPQAMPVPPPAAPRMFIVYFDWDKDNITQAADQVIMAAAEAYRSGAPVQLKVTGYTDRSGSPGYNQRLSERRANNVAKRLAALGVPPDQMAVSGHGENENRVPTADGVRERENRRVEIIAP